MGLNLRSTLAGCVASGRYLIPLGLRFLLSKMGTIRICASHTYFEEVSALPGASPSPPEQTSPRPGTGTLLSSRSVFCRSSFRDFSDFSSFCRRVLSSSYKKTNTIAEARGISSRSVKAGDRVRDSAAHLHDARSYDPTRDPSMHPWVVMVHLPSTQEPREELGTGRWWSVLRGAEGHLGGGNQGCGGASLA